MSADRKPLPRPQPPLRPDDADCCGEGCPRCIFDVYDDAMAAFEARLAQWKASESSRVPQSTAGTCTSQVSAVTPDDGVSQFKPEPARD